MIHNVVRFVPFNYFKDIMNHGKKKVFSSYEKNNKSNYSTCTFFYSSFCLLLNLCLKNISSLFYIHFDVVVVVVVANVQSMYGVSPWGHSFIWWIKFLFSLMMLHFVSNKFCIITRCAHNGCTHVYIHIERNHSNQSNGVASFGSVIRFILHYTVKEKKNALTFYGRMDVNLNRKLVISADSWSFAFSIWKLYENSIIITRAAHSILMLKFYSLSYFEGK